MASDRNGQMRRGQLLKKGKFKKYFVTNTHET